MSAPTARSSACSERWGKCEIGQAVKTWHNFFAPAGQATAGRSHYSPAMNTTELPAESPAQSRRRPSSKPRGRQTDPRALEEVRALLGDRPRRRDLLIEHLHLLQDRYGHLSAAHLAALAQEMKIAPTEVYGVAPFSAHFDGVKEGEPAPPAVTVRVCDSL